MISLIIPAFNEEKRLPITLYELFSFLGKKKIDAEIIVVDDGSTDNTLAVVENYCKRYNNLRLIGLKKNEGKGYAVKSGVLSSTGDIVIFLDSDNSTSLEHIEDVVALIGSGHDIVIGSRDVRGADIIKQQPLSRLFIGKIFGVLVSIVHFSKYADTQCGFKGFKKNVATKIFSKTRIKGFAFDVEVLSIAHQYRFSVKEIPVKWKNDVDTKVKMKNIFDMFFDILKIRINQIVGRYDK